MGADPTLSDNGAAMNRTLLLAIGFACLTACTSYRDDVMTICDAPDKIGDTTNMKPTEKMAKMGQWCVDNVSSKKGKDLLELMTSMGRGGRNKLLRQEAGRLGINPCHLADSP